MKRCPACAEPFDSAGWQCPACGCEPQNIDGFSALAPELAHNGDGFLPEYFEELARLEAGNFWFQTRNKLIIHALQKYFPDFKSFFEIGCGTAFVLSAIGAAFPNAALTGSEIFIAGLVYAARRLPHAEFFQMDARRIPYESHFDVIGAFDMLEHIKEDQTVLIEIYRALRPGGGVILTVPQHPWLWSRQDEMACHMRRYTRSELIQKVAKAGFEVVYITSFVSLLLPFMWISRRLRQRNCKIKLFDPLAELKINPFVNWILGIVMKLERIMIRLGVRFPFGGSLLLVARKA
ncbi:MAG: class I SAM-dependent methyltransferase [Dissulfurimicrobium sp.]|uniref:class I SAM-dependent methyltransferase n=1 Tax=Dissulfurimicrobium sp. TaxID=2022436 RepID=UPI003D10BAFB